DAGSSPPTRPAPGKELPDFSLRPCREAALAAGRRGDSDRLIRMMLILRRDVVHHGRQCSDTHRLDIVSGVPLQDDLVVSLGDRRAATLPSLDQAREYGCRMNSNQHMQVSRDYPQTEHLGPLLTSDPGQVLREESRPLCADDRLPVSGGPD